MISEVGREGNAMEAVSLLCDEKEFLSGVHNATMHARIYVLKTYVMVYVFQPRTFKWFGRSWSHDIDITS